jgi:hypothetical protein
LEGNYLGGIMKVYIIRVSQNKNSERNLLIENVLRLYANILAKCIILAESPKQVFVESKEKQNEMAYE